MAKFASSCTYVCVFCVCVCVCVLIPVTCLYKICDVMNEMCRNMVLPWKVETCCCVKGYRSVIVSMVVFIISFIILRHTTGCIALKFVKSVRSEVLLAVTRSFGWTLCLHYQNALRPVSSETSTLQQTVFVTLITEVSVFSETLVLAFPIDYATLNPTALIVEAAGSSETSV